MAHIKKIKFSRVGKQEGCTCDRCGQYIRNIWTVDYKEGLTMNYGIDCWEAICKEGLSKQGIRLMNKTMKSLQSYEERLAAYTSKEITEENDMAYQTEQADWNKDSYWYGRSWEEYRDWMVNDFFPERISGKQKELERFSKVDFKA